jgi:CPA2 family monovalent cation:H+ antiporter-2
VVALIPYGRAAVHPDLHILARAIDRDHVYKLWSMGCRDIVRETYDSSIRMGRSAFEALGHDRQQATAMADAFEELDRSSMVQIADVYDVDILPWDNEPLMAKLSELKKTWDPMLREQMEEIINRGNKN